LVRLCFEADNPLNAIGVSPTIHGKRPISLKVAAIRYLAKERGLPITSTS